MARRSTRQMSYYTSQPVRTPHPILNSILACFVTLIICFVLITTCGPILDYFAMYVASQPEGAAPYANAVLPLFPWSYTFIVVIGIISVVAVWIAVVRSLTYRQYGG